MLFKLRQIYWDTTTLETKEYRYITYQQIPGTIVGVLNSFSIFSDIFPNMSYWTYGYILEMMKKKYLELQENLFPFFPFLTSIS